MGAHLDSQLCDKISWGEYVDFARLLPRERPSYADEGKLEIVNKGGQMYFVPAGERDYGNTISNFHRWEQAFRVYSNIYLRSNPDRVTELIQYNHIICTASQTYLWENVYNYNREFRMHLSNFPGRSWECHITVGMVNLSQRQTSDWQPRWW